MRLILKQKGIFTRNIAHIEPNYLEICINGGVRIYQKNDLFFDKTFDYRRSNALFINKNKVIIDDFPVIRCFDLIHNEEIIYHSEIISSALFLWMYQDNKLLLTHGEYGYTPIVPLTLCIIENGIVKKQWETPPIPAKQVEISVKNGYVFVPNYELNLITTLDSNNGKILWQFDISQLGTYLDHTFYKEPPKECKRKIERIYYHNDKVIVAFSLGIIALHPRTGEVFWKILFEDRHVTDLIFDGNIAYAARGFAYTLIDIEQGGVLYKNDCKTKKIIVISGKEILKNWFSYRLICLRNGFIWSYTQYEGRWYLSKLEPSTGEFVDGCVLPIEVSQSPVFIENTVYIRDGEGNLNIFELEE